MRTLKPIDGSEASPYIRIGFLSGRTPETESKGGLPGGCVVEVRTAACVWMNSPSGRLSDHLLSIPSVNPTTATTKSWEFGA